MRQIAYKRLFDPIEDEVNSALSEGWQILHISSIHATSSFEPSTTFHLVKYDKEETN